MRCHQIRDYAFDKHRRVDDSPYGGGKGMVMMCEPIYLCYLDVCKMTGKKPVVPENLEDGNNWSLVEGNKELYIIPGAVHTALYDDRAGVIPYDKMVDFFTQNLK